MKEAIIEKAIEEDRDVYSQELYGKASSLLTPGESWRLDEYIHDCRNPEWKVWQNNEGDPTVELSQTGRIRYIEGKQPVRQYSNEPGGYKRAGFASSIGGIDYSMLTHIMVARLFVPNDDPENKTQVNHIDGNKQNNWYRNLEWVTPSDNIKHAMKTGLIGSGENYPTAKYPDDTVREICRTLQENDDLTFGYIAKLFNVSQEYVEALYHKKLRKDITSQYDFPKRNTVIRGEDVRTVLYTNEQVDKVCQMLNDKYFGSSNKPLRVIAEECGVSKRMVEHVYAGEYWTQISSKYPFYKYKFENK